MTDSTKAPAHYWPQHPVSTAPVVPLGWTPAWREIIARGGDLLWWVRPDGVRIAPDGVEIYVDRSFSGNEERQTADTFQKNVPDIIRQAMDEQKEARASDAVILSDRAPLPPLTNVRVTRESTGWWRERALAAEAKLAKMAAAEEPGGKPPTDVERVIDQLEKRIIGTPDRTKLRRALDRADAPDASRDGQDAAVGRALRLGR